MSVLAGRRAKRAGEHFVDSRAFEALSRAGFVARALVWGIIGALALKLALGAGGSAPSQQGALSAVSHQPAGHVLLTLVAVGLGGYALWRFVRAALGHGPEGADSGFDRAAAAASGCSYALLCALAVEILLGSGGGSANTHRTAAGVLSWPGGTWLVGAAGAVMLGIGGYQVYRGIARKFLDDSKVEEMGEAVRGWVTVVGSVGCVARGIVFGLVGVFLLKAAIEYEPNNAVGLDGALEKLVRASYGPYLLGVVAAGLVVFALFSLSDARYRRI